jgi:HEAT repeat protein
MVRIGSPLHASEVARVRTNIAFALGSLGDERARDPLTRLLHDNDHSRDLAPVSPARRS